MGLCSHVTSSLVIIEPFLCTAESKLMWGWKTRHILGLKPAFLATECSSDKWHEPRSKIALWNIVLLGLLGVQLFSGVRGSLTTWIHMFQKVGQRALWHNCDNIGVCQRWWLREGQGLLSHLGNLAPCATQSHMKMILSREDTWKGKT